MDKDEYTIEHLRRSLDRSIETERHTLSRDVKRLANDVDWRILSSEVRATYGAKIPADIDAKLRELTLLRRTRYMQYLRAILDDFADDM